VAVVDSGVDYGPQLTGRVTEIDLAGQGPRDCVGHGTAVADGARVINVSIQTADNSRHCAPRWRSRCAGTLTSYTDRKTRVSVTAPGANIASAWPGGYNPANQGTSFAAAFVSGVAALVRAATRGCPRPR
jgi:subtilisin family serine protease